MTTKVAGLRRSVAATSDRTNVFVYRENTGRVAVASVETLGRCATYYGTAAIDGIPGTHVPISIALRDTAGASSGDKQRTAANRAQADGWNRLRLNMSSSGNPVGLNRNSFRPRAQSTHIAMRSGRWRNPLSVRKPSICPRMPDHICFSPSTIISSFRAMSLKGGYYPLPRSRNDGVRGSNPLSSTSDLQRHTSPIRSVSFSVLWSGGEKLPV